MNWKLLYVFLLFCSCSSETGFIIGTWELGGEKGVSQIIIKDDQTITWKIEDAVVIDRSKFDIIETERQSVTIQLKSKIGNESNRMTFKPLDQNSVLIINYKDHIHPNIIDEVMLAKIDVNRQTKFDKPSKEAIILPNNYSGEFFILYDNKYANDANLIRIEKNGLGMNNSPQFIQLFEPNRLIKYVDSSNSIPILNPDYYGELSLTSNLLNSFDEKQIVVIQHGFNQSRIEKWKSKTRSEISSNTNVEYFECLTISSIREKYNL